MNREDFEELRRLLLGPKQTTSAAGSITERSVEELERAVRLLKKLNDATEKRASLDRVGTYGRRYD